MSRKNWKKSANVLQQCNGSRDGIPWKVVTAATGFELLPEICSVSKLDQETEKGIEYE